MTRWWPIRKRLAAIAVTLASLSSLMALGVTGSRAVGVLGIVYIVVTAAAVILPAATTVQVVFGQLLVGVLFLGPFSGTATLTGVLLFGAVVGTAEVLAIVARLDSPFERDPSGDYRAAVQSALLGGAVCGAVLLMATLPGPGGLLGLVTSSVACALLGAFIWIRTRESFTYEGTAGTSPGKG